MIIFPAIDLKGGACVRLEKGALDKATLFNDDPVDQAKKFARAGAAWLHMVDLDGAFAGRPVNAEAVKNVIAASSLKIQLGGGIRNRDMLDKWLALGVARVVLGTAALKNPDLVRGAASDYPERIVVAVDAKAGKVAVEGWAESSNISAIELGQRFEQAGVAALLYTDVDRDGLMAGVNCEATLALAEAVSIPVIASGGVADLGDIRRLKAIGLAAKGRIEGVIVGRALYDGRLDLQQALALMRA